MKLKWLEIERFRNVAPGTRLEFDDGFNVVLGRNGTGKTTLLRLIEAVVTGDYRPFVRESFTIECELSSGDSRLCVRVSHHRNVRPADGVRPVTARLASETSQTEVNLVCDEGETTRLMAASSPNGTLISADGDTFSAASITISHESIFLSLGRRFTESKRELKPKMLHRLAAYHDLNARFDEATELFSNLIGHTGPRESPYLMEAEGSGVILGLGFFPEQHSLFEHPTGEHSQPTMLLSHVQLPFLEELARLLDAESVCMIFNRSHNEGEPGSRVVYFDHPVFQVSFPSGLDVAHDHLSYGQRRLMAYAYYLETITGPVIADELVNGMHHTWIESCLQHIEASRKQAFLTSQNPLLLDYLEFESAEEAQRAFVLCELDGDTFVWRQMSDDEARRFYSAYEVGVQHVGDILRTKGLW